MSASQLRQQHCFSRLTANEKRFLFWGVVVVVQEGPDLDALIVKWLEELEYPESTNEKKKSDIDGDCTGKDGALAIINGQLVLKKPTTLLGKWPTIMAEQNGHVRVLHDGKTVERPLVLEDVQGIQFELINLAARSFFQVEVSPDLNSVWLCLEYLPGTIHEVCSSDYVTDLVVVAKAARQLEPQPIDPRVVQERLQKLGIKAEIDLKLLKRVCADRKSGRWKIAVGVQPQPPVDGLVETVYNLRTSTQRENCQGTINPLDRRSFDSVAPGEVLAIWQPPILGKPGINVYGQKIEPPAPKWARFVAGSEVKLLENGRVAVAEIAGRPSCELGQICVKPELVFDQDMDVSIGNVDFTGDVIVDGDVKESITIKAGGMVQIRGSIYHARILAGGDVTIGHSLIGGKVTVGAEMANGMRVIALLRRIHHQLAKLLSDFAELDPHLSMTVPVSRRDGYLIKLALENTVSELPALFRQLGQLVPAREDLKDDSEVDRIWSLLHLMRQRYAGANPLGIKSISEVQASYAGVGRIIDLLTEVFCSSANIHVDYCQNAILEATGDIIVSGPLAYGCTMSAGSRIDIAGSCRSGAYFASSSITLDSAGLNETVRTDLSVDEGGFIAAGTFYPGVQLRIGSAKLSIEKPCYNLKFQFEDGKWVETYWK